MDSSIPGPESVAHNLISDLGTSLDPTCSSLSITNSDPVLSTRFRAGEAAAAVLAAHARLAAQIWCRRGGTPQRVEVDVYAAAASLLSFLLQHLPDAQLPLRIAPTIAFFRGRDDQWIHLHGGFPSLHSGTIALLGCADNAAAIAAAVAHCNAQDLEDALAERGLCGARLRSAAEWNTHPQGVALAAVPLVEVTRIGNAPPESLPGPCAGEAGARPLSGLRVLDLTRVLAGPTCARTLAEHGAEVLHIRSPHLPFIEPFVIDTNPGKRSCYLDLNHPGDVAQLRTLTRTAHVFSQGYRTGALAQRGFAAEDLAELRPGIIVVSINCYGHTGPWSGRPGWEQLAQTATGMACEHSADQTPAVVPAALTDYLTGHLAALGVMHALLQQTTDGGSWHVRVSLARTAMWIQSLPRTPEGVPPSGVDPKLLAPWWIEMKTAWGRLGRLGPIARMSETPPRWELPPVPLGTHPPHWA